MKKVMPILLALLILLTSTCFAAYEPDPTQWELILANEDSKLYWNKSTVQYSEDKNAAVFETCLIDLKNDKHAIWRSKITRQPRTIVELQDDLDEESIQTIIDTPFSAYYKNEPILIAPVSLNEHFYEAVWQTKLPDIKNRFKNIVKTKEIQYFLDTASIQYSADGNIATYWTVLFFPELQMTQTIYYQAIKQTEMTMPLYTAINTNPPKPVPPEKQTAKKIVSDSNGAEIFRTIFPE